MKKDGAWGDHIVVQAAANYFKVLINIIPSSDPYSGVIPINPKLDPGEHVVNNPLVLGHVAEYHYVSLEPVSGELCSYVFMRLSKMLSNLEVTRCFMMRLHGNQLLAELMTSFNPLTRIKPVSRA